MAYINKKSEQFLEKYLNNCSPTGFEAEGQKIWLEYIKPYVDEVGLDDYGTAYGVINPEKEFSVAIEAHADEIAWFVNYITSDGLIYVTRNGGSDHIIAPAMRVDIHTKQGRVEGVFGWPAIHLRRGKDDVKPETKKLFIDIGVSTKEEAIELGVEVGCVITFQDGYTKIRDYYCGRALDNRMGGFCIAQVARHLKENKIELPYKLYIINAVQEEIGLRGAQMIAHRLKPNAAIVVDVTHVTTTPMIDQKVHGEVKAGEGPSMTVGPAVHNKLFDLIVDAGKENDIKVQREAASRSTGTDTDAFAYSNMGVPSALISIPLKYMHTTVEMAHKDDVEGVIGLYVHALQKIENNHSFKYFDVSKL